MDDSLKDPKVILGVLAIINAIVLALVFQWWRNRKSFSYDVISNVPLLSIRQEIKHRVQVLFDGNAVENVHLVIIRISNSGRVPIEVQDFAVPLNVNFGRGSEVLTTEVTKTMPSDLPVTISHQKESLTIDPLMLNRGDSITIQVLVSTPTASPKVSGRVKGIPSLKKADTPGGFRGYLYETVSEIIKPVLALLLAVVVAVTASVGLVMFEQLGFIRFILAPIPMLLFFLLAFYLLYRIEGRGQQ
ncbi:MAG TPA: hypothetical protein VJ843_00060 [Candidatus Saccharimonadales bacterium]|nr:hypothetical protein [Candidatus Saccharimonadales bacterium]